MIKLQKRHWSRLANHIACIGVLLKQLTNIAYYAILPFIMLHYYCDCLL